MEERRAALARGCDQLYQPTLLRSPNNALIFDSQIDRRKQFVELNSRLDG